MEISIDWHCILCFCSNRSSPYTYLCAVYGDNYLLKIVVSNNRGWNMFNHPSIYIHVVFHFPFWITIPGKALCSPFSWYCCRDTILPKWKECKLRWIYCYKYITSISIDTENNEGLWKHKLIRTATTAVEEWTIIEATQAQAQAQAQWCHHLFRLNEKF